MRPVLLFPFDDAIPLASLSSSGAPLALIVPDGTWRQASKVKNRVSGLLDVTSVSLPPGPRSSYRLRTESHPERVSTIEAIARALGVLEGAHVQIALEAIFRLMVERTLQSRDSTCLD